ncbi:MAG: S8 family serine peptidase, partial [Acidobacteriota bacterium]|nr:S8 family serine peptidase [Acidobacteriota bacterium]
MAFLRSLPVWVLFFGVAHSATVPNRFIVELATEPVTDHLARTGGVRANLMSARASGHRARIQQEQRQLGLALQQNGASVLEGVDTVANALFVQTTEADPEPWKNLPNVLRVTPVHTVEMLLDRAVVVNRIIDAWARIGGSGNAGSGMKIAIVDSGVDIGRPGFLNSPLAVPANFPLTNADSDTAFTNNKVIVARSYVSLLPNPDSDISARDHSGHGTALATIAAGGASAGPSATIAGIAPGAWIGSYKVFGSPGQNDSASDDVILKALDDAVKDGMDVINLSFGSDIASRVGDDLEVQAVERATSAGAMVVIAAGNNGTDANTISSPGTAPDAITVGAQQNDRIFSASAQVAGLAPFLALPGDGPAPAGPVSGVLVDIQTLDPTGLACGDLPVGSLSNRVALILRGACTFETKLNNAAKAGASGALIYAAANAPGAIHITVGSAQLPAEMIGNADGITLKQALAAGSISAVTLTFTLSPVSIDPSQTATFSAAGPNVDSSIKPDLVAVGENYYVATQTFDPGGEMYSPSGYIVVSGTSFSAPTTAGAAALLKAARPGLTVAQYRSLLINSATPVNAKLGVAATVQQ